MCSFSFIHSVHSVFGVRVNVKRYQEKCVDGVVCTQYIYINKYHFNSIFSGCYECVCVLRESVCQCLCVCLSMCVCVWNNDKILFQLDHKQNQAWNATQFHRNRTKYSHWHICWHRSFTLLFAFASYFSFLLSHCVIPSIKNSHIDWVRVKHIDIMRVVGVTLYAIQLNAWWAFSRYASIKFSTITVFIWSVLSVCVCGCVRAPDIYRTGI